MHIIVDLSELSQPLFTWAHNKLRVRICGRLEQVDCPEGKIDGYRRFGEFDNEMPHCVHNPIRSHSFISNVSPSIFFAKCNKKCSRKIATFFPPEIYLTLNKFLCTPWMQYEMFTAILMFAAEAFADYVVRGEPENTVEVNVMLINFRRKPIFRWIRSRMRECIGRCHFVICTSFSTAKSAHYFRAVLRIRAPVDILTRTDCNIDASAMKTACNKNTPAPNTKNIYWNEMTGKEIVAKYWNVDEPEGVSKEKKSK